MHKQPNQDIVRYIEKHLEKGFELKHIKKKLAEVGHPIEAIEDAAEYVLSTKPHLIRKPKKFMILYGIILILLIAGFVWFIWFKATQQAQYTTTVAEIQKNQSYLGRSDVELLKMAAAGDMTACDYISGHNENYYCLDKIWVSDNCLFLFLTGGESDNCYYRKALGENSSGACDRINNGTLMEKCRVIISRGISEQQYDYEEEYGLSPNPRAYQDNKVEAVVEDFIPSKSVCMNNSLGDEYIEHCIIYAAKKGFFDELISFYESVKRDNGGQGCLCGYKLFISAFDAIKNGNKEGCSSISTLNVCGSGCTDVGKASKEISAFCLAVLDKDNEECIKSRVMKTDGCSAFISNNGSECGSDRLCILFFKYF